MFLIFFLSLMLFNGWLATKMAGNDPFSAFIVLAFLTNGLAGVFFARIYVTLMKNDKKNKEKE